MYTKVKIENIKNRKKASKTNLYKDNNDSTPIILDDEIFCCSPNNSSCIIIFPTNSKKRSQIFTPVALSERSTSTIIEKFGNNFNDNEKIYEDNIVETDINETAPQELYEDKSEEKNEEKNEEKIEEKNEEKIEEKNEEPLFVSKSGKNLKKILRSSILKKEKQNSIKNRVSAKVKIKNTTDNNKNNNIIYNKVVKKKFLGLPEEKNNKEKKRKASISPPPTVEKPTAKNRERRNSTVKICSTDYKKYITNKLNDEKSKNNLRYIQKTSKQLNKVNINKDEFIKLNATPQRKVNFYDKPLKKQIIKRNNQKSNNLENSYENKSFYCRMRGSQKKFSKNNEKPNENLSNSLYLSKNNQLYEQRNNKNENITSYDTSLEKLNNKNKSIIKKPFLQQHNNATNKNSVKFRPFSLHKIKKKKSNEQLLSSFAKNNNNNNFRSTNTPQIHSARSKKTLSKFLLSSKKKEKNSVSSSTSSNNSEDSIINDEDLNHTKEHKRKNTILTEKDHFELKNLNKENIESYSNKEKIENFNEHLELCLETIIDLDMKSQPRCKMDINFNFPKELQKKKIALFDLDETLIHCVGEIKPDQNPELKYDDKITVNLPIGRKAIIGINERPLWRESLDKIKQYYNIVIYTASHSSYSDAILNFLDKEDKYFHYRLYRNNCVQCTSSDGMKFYVKDLDILKKYYDLKDIIIVDNSVLSFTFHLNNGIPVIPYYDSKEDSELNLVALYLLSIVDCNDLRLENEKHFQLQKCLEIARKNKECEENSDDVVSPTNESANESENENITRGNSIKKTDTNKKQNNIETITNIGKRFTPDFMSKVGRTSFHQNTCKFQLTNNFEKVRTDRKSGSSMDNKMSYIKVLREVYQKYAERGTGLKTTYRNSLKRAFNKNI